MSDLIINILKYYIVIIYIVKSLPSFLKAAPDYERSRQNMQRIRVYVITVISY